MITLNRTQTSAAPLVVESYTNGVMMYSYGGTSQATKLWQVRDSVNTPGFRAHAVSPLPENPFSYSEINETFSAGWWRTDGITGWNQSQWTIQRGNFGSPAPGTKSLSNLEKQALRSKAINGLRLKLKDQSVNVAQFYGEWDQTSRLLATSVARIGKAVSALRHGDIAGAARALGVKVPNGSSNFYRRWERNQSEAISTGWLELQYGWLPLLSDAYGSVKFLDTFLKAKPLLFHASTRKQVSRSDYLKTQQAEYIEEYFYQSKFEVSSRCSYRMTAAPYHNWSSLGFTNPVDLAWELLPFSFVVDWFIPIGNFLSSLDATLGLTFVDGSTTEFQKDSVMYMKTGKDLRQTVPGYNHYNSQSGVIQSRQEVVTVNRVNMNDFPSSLLPIPKNPFSQTHFFNALALLKLNFRR